MGSVADLDPRWEELQRTFTVELGERTAALTQLLRRLEQGDGGEHARSDTFDALLREAHSVKGATRAVALTHAHQWARLLESALQDARGAPDPLPRHWFDAAYSAVDTLGRLALDGDSAAFPSFPDMLSAEGGMEPEVAPPPATDQVAREETPSRMRMPAPPDVPQDAPAGTTTRGHTRTQEPAQSVRVSVGKLDALLAQSGELTVTHIRIAQRLRELEELRRGLYSWRREWRVFRGRHAGLRRIARAAEPTDGTLGRELAALLQVTDQAEERTQATFRQLEAIASQLHNDIAQLGFVSQGIAEEVMAARLVPTTTIAAPFERVVRDLARTQHKEAQVVLEGVDTEIDRKILEQLRDPLLHMVRNAIDHGIEPPAQREAAGKPRTGTIRLSVVQGGSEITLVLEDDGAGLDPVVLRRSAVRKGILSEDQAASLDDRAALELIFRPGFSTSATITEISGRGVGMDVVREHLKGLNGQVIPTSTPGNGTRFTIRVPLTLATTRAVLVEQSGHIYAIPASMIERNARVKEQQLVHIEGRRVVAIEGHPVTVVELADVLERPRTAVDAQDGSQWRSYVVLCQDDQRVALLADKLLGEQELVVKPLGWPLQRIRNVSGAAVLGSGQTIAILNPSDMLPAALKIAAAGDKPVAPQAVAPGLARRKRRVLVVDDSLPTRSLERSILVAAGYDTAVAADGAEALKVLRSEEIDLVISDIEMPVLDGFALTAEIRRDETLRQIPVVLVTSLASREHRERGVVVGADAYIVKGNFDQGRLLDTVGRLIA